MSKTELDNVSYIYGKGTPYEILALDGVSIRIEDNRLTGIIGHTGSGKSTLVRLLNGLEKPLTGKVLLDGADIWQNPKKMADIRYRVGLVMQYPEYQLFEETVEKDIAYAPRNMKLSPEEISKRVKESAEFCGVGRELWDKSPFDLSGGQKRRVAIAGVMAMRPEVLVLDEPAAGLDPGGRRDIFTGVHKYANETGAAVIIISHSMEDMAEYCDDIIVLSHGRLLMHGTRDEVFGHAKQLEESGLDVPQITKLMMYLKDAGIEVDSGTYTVEKAEAEILELLGDKNR